MKKHSISVASVFTLVVAGIALVSMESSRNQASAEDKPKVESKSKFTPVDNLHHFMEYINEPAFKSLHSALKNRPKNKETWDDVKSAALILAETSSLVAKRSDNVMEKGWQSSSLTVHIEGKKLYQAAREEDYDSAKEFLKSMTVGCQKCHEEYR